MMAPIVAAGRFCVWSCIFLIACSSLPSHSDQSISGELNAEDLCKVQGNARISVESSTLAAFRNAIESGPIYGVAAAAGVSSCSIRSESGAVLIEYHFKDGGRLHVKRDPRIEYTEQIARVRLAPEKNPVEILAAAERKAFGENGCGIDWQNSDTWPVLGDPKVKETLFYGDLCNCRAGFRRDASGRVVELMLRSAC